MCVKSPHKKLVAILLLTENLVVIHHKIIQQRQNLLFELEVIFRHHEVGHKLKSVVVSNEESLALKIVCFKEVGQSSE